MAVFRKLISATRGKMKAPDIKYETEQTGGTPNEKTKSEFEARSDEWREELKKMGEQFLVMKTPEEAPDMDTAYIDDRDGLPVLKAVFDVGDFKKEELNISVEDNVLQILGKTTEERDDKTFTKTLIRKVDLPQFVDEKMLHADVANGVLTVEMPFHFPPRKSPPAGPNVYPIREGPDGKRKICIALNVGTEFTEDDVNVTLDGKKLLIHAAYDADVGKYGQQKSLREINREYQLPDTLEVDETMWHLEPDGRLIIELCLKMDKPYKCQIYSEEVS